MGKNKNGKKRINSKTFMDKELIKELRKIDSKMNFIKEEVNLGTLDNTILALMILMAGIFVAIIVSGLVSFPPNPTYLLIMLIAVLFSLPFIQLFIGYLNSIFFEKNRFANKINTLVILMILFTFVILLISLPYLLAQLFPKMNQNDPKVFYILALIVYGLPIVTWFYLKPKVSIYFVKKFPNILLKSIDKMAKSQRENALRKLKTNYKDLKKYAKN